MMVHVFSLPNLVCTVYGAVHASCINGTLAWPLDTIAKFPKTFHICMNRLCHHCYQFLLQPQNTPMPLQMHVTM